MNFSQLGLSQALLQSIELAGYKMPTPIQVQAIPRILEGGDLIASALTGTGKTAAFALPILHKLSQKNYSKVRPIRCLVLAPTRELVSQVGGAIKTLGVALSPKLRCIEIFGGVKVEAQEHKLKLGCDILVATPGRLLDLMKQNIVKLSTVEILVLDEGDRMLELGFMPDLKRIVAALPVHCQKMMFSATFSDEVEHLASFFLHKPHRIATAGEAVVVSKIRQVVYGIHTPDKPVALRTLLELNDEKQILVFVNTRAQAVELSRWLGFCGFSVGSLHGDVDQKGRAQVLAAFQNSTVRVLVATDVAARGLHIADLPLVINYEVPGNIEDYVHRIGRTGRAGKPGKALTLVAPAEMETLGYIEDLIGEKIDRQKISGFKPAPTEAPRKRKEELRLAEVEREQHARKSAARTGKPGSKDSGKPARKSAGRPAKAGAPSGKTFGKPAGKPTGKPSFGGSAKPAPSGKPAVGGKPTGKKAADRKKSNAQPAAKKQAPARKLGGKQRPGR